MFNKPQMSNRTDMLTHIKSANENLALKQEEKAELKKLRPAQDNTLNDYKNISTNAKVMVISAEEVNAEVMRGFLNKYGFNNVVFTHELLNAFELIFQERPDAILYESGTLTAPDFRILEQIRNNARARLVPLLILIAEADEMTKLRALELGVVEIIVKPASANELALRLRNILSVKTYHDQIASQDGLTKLPNREAFINRVDRALKYSKRYKSIGAVLEIGLIRLNNINNAYGINVGDQLLKSVAGRIENAVREEDLISRVDEQDTETTISRLGRNGFLILLPIISKVDDAALVSLRLHEKIIAPYLIDEKELHIECKIGISIFPDDGLNKDIVINAASIALNKAKTDNNVNHTFYSKELNDLTTYRINMEDNLRKAIQKNQFEIYYQPKLSVTTKEIIGAEALLRWPHPELGFIGPDEFIPIAEESGNIQALGNWVINDVVRQIKQWEASGITPPRIAINISSHQFQSKTFLNDIKTVLNQTKTDGRFLTIELTETAVKDNIHQIINTLNQLKSLGIKISIDDFGTGYSSLAQLTQLPLDELKIDRTFTKGIGHEKSTESIILAIIAMAHNLGLSVVAEGVEVEEQLNFLRSNHCDEFQGYLFSPAITADRFGILIA